MNSQVLIKGDPLSWLLEQEDPGVRYLALRDLVKLPPEEPELCAAREKAHFQGPIADLLQAMDEQGFWVEPGPGYYPKYRGTVWSLVTLAQLGASVAVDERIKAACAYLLDHTLTPGGQFGANGTPSSTADCLQGNLCWACLELGYEDPRLDTAFEWMARSVTGEGLAPAEERGAERRYYAGKCGPIFACGSNNKLPCAWGAAKVMLAFGRLPATRRTPLIEQAIQVGVDFLFSVDPAQANYPSGWSDKPSRNWWKFGFPLFYVTDILQLVEALVALGYVADPRLASALQLVREKQDADQRLALEYDYAGKVWVDFGKKNQPNKWVTIRTLRAMKSSGSQASC